jgi:small subunit ribosomal protein S13
MKEIKNTRISGVILPPQKSISRSLTYIYGIGYTTAKKICSALNLNPEQKTNDISDAEARTIETYIADNLVVSNDLKKEIRDNITSLLTLNGFRAKKHKQRRKS